MNVVNALNKGLLKILELVSVRIIKLKLQVGRRESITIISTFAPIMTSHDSVISSFYANFDRTVDSESSYWGTLTQGSVGITWALTYTSY